MDTPDLFDHLWPLIFFGIFMFAQFILRALGAKPGKKPIQQAPDSKHTKKQPPFPQLPEDLMTLLVPQEAEEEPPQRDYLAELEEEKKRLKETENIEQPKSFKPKAPPPAVQYARANLGSLGNSKTLKKAIVLKEILDAPLSKRKRTLLR